MEGPHRAFHRVGRVRRCDGGFPTGQLMAAGELQFAQYRGDVSLDRLDRDGEPPGDLLVGVAAGNLAKHLTFHAGSVGQLGVGRPGERACEGIEHKAGEAGEKTASPSEMRWMASTSSPGEIDLVT